MSSPHRDQMVLTAVTLFQHGGYWATSWRKLVQESGAPWGSAHHYFPGGKEQLGVAAIETAARGVAALITQCFSPDRTAVQSVHALFTVSAVQLSRSGFRAGCPVTTVALETVPDLPAMAAACSAAFALWEDALAGGLQRCGIAADRAAELAAIILAMFEGALVVARVRQSAKPLEASAKAAILLLGGNGDIPHFPQRGK